MILKIRKVSIGAYVSRLRYILSPPGVPVRLEGKPKDPVTRKEFLDFIDTLGHEFLKDLAEDLDSINEELKRLDQKR